MDLCSNPTDATLDANYMWRPLLNLSYFDSKESDGIGVPATLRYVDCLPFTVITLIWGRECSQITRTYSNFRFFIIRCYKLYRRYAWTPNDVSSFFTRRHGAVVRGCVALLSYVTKTHCVADFIYFCVDIVFVTYANISRCYIFLYGHHAVCP